MLSLSADETPMDCLDLNGHICPFHSALAKRPARPRRCLVDSLDMSHKTSVVFSKLQPWPWNFQKNLQNLNRDVLFWLGVVLTVENMMHQTSFHSVFCKCISCHSLSTMPDIHIIHVDHVHTGWDSTLATWISLPLRCTLLSSFTVFAT